MKILSLNDLGGESEKFRGFLKKLQAGLSISTYDTDKKVFNEECLFVDLFKDRTINNDSLKDISFEEQLEATFVLTHRFLGYIRTKPKRVLEDDFEKKIFLHNYKNEPDSDYHDKIIASLTRFENFFREVVFLLYPDKKAEITEKATLYDLTEDKTLNLVKHDDSITSNINETIRNFSNKSRHENPDSPFYIPKDENGDEQRKRVLHLLASFIILVIWYRYDDIYDALEKNGAFTPEGVAIKGSETLESYIGKLKNEQFNIINYKIYKSSDTSCLKQIIDVNLKFHTNSKEEGNEDSEESLVNASKLIDDPDEHFTLLAGESGAGKTTMLAYMIDRVIASWEQDKENMPLPIKIEFENKLIIKGKNGVNIYQYHSLFDHILANIALEEEIELTNEKLNPIRIYLKQLLETGKCILFIEGLNDCSERQRRKQYFVRIKKTNYQ